MAEEFFFLCRPAGLLHNPKVSAGQGDKRSIPTRFSTSYPFPEPFRQPAATFLDIDAGGQARLGRMRNAVPVSPHLFLTSYRREGV